VISRASFAAAYSALELLAITLLLGPWRLLRGVRQPISDDLRRDIGIWAGILGVVHSVIGQCVHLRGRPWLYHLYDARSHHPFPVRHDLFGFANYTGAMSSGCSSSTSDLERSLLATAWNTGVEAPAALELFIVRARGNACLWIPGN